MNYDYLICGHCVRFELPWTVKLTKESAPFLAEPGSFGTPELTVRFSCVDSLTLPSTGGHWHTGAYYTTKEGLGQVWHCPSRNEPPYCCVEWNKPQLGQMTCYYVRGQEHHIAYTKNLLELVGLETLLLYFDTVLLHSALVDWEGKGILFCAPSGTGKSTQAELWRKYTGSRILNGDRAGICYRQEIWEAWGLPFAGTSGIYCNQSVPLRAVVLLQQGADNELMHLRPAEAFRGMLPQCNARRWDLGFMNRLTDVLSSLVGCIPTYQLKCRPDVEAVELLRSVLMEVE